MTTAPPESLPWPGAPRPERPILAGAVKILVASVVVALLTYLTWRAAVGAGAVLGLGVVATLGWILFCVGMRRAHVARRSVGIAAGLIVAAIVVAGTLAVSGANAHWSISLGVPLMLMVLLPGSFNAGIWQGRGSRPRFLVYALAAWLALPATAGWITYMFAGPGYYAEFNRVKAGLAAIPGIEILDTGGNRDVTFEDIWARFRVEGKGEIMLLGLTPASLRDTSHLAVSNIGPYSFHSERWGYGAVIDRHGKPAWHASHGFTLDLGAGGDFGPNGRFAGKLNATIRSVSDLTAHYDEVCAALHGLAQSQERLFFQNADGSTMEYFIRTGERARGKRRR